ncbi:MAG TPA: VOC family protein [Vicinamibacterales bacterium]|nr:VOC family protein [Vicinamibacterales bacterium]
MTSINGAHFLIYSPQPEADRAFLRDVFGFRSVDAGEGWPIFALPPAEIAVHPAEDDDVVQEQAEHDMVDIVLYLMCDDVHAVVASLKARGVMCKDVGTAPWGLHTVIQLPSGGHIGLYQPTHPTAIQM